jgi:hypothetical protein
MQRLLALRRPIPLFAAVSLAAVALGALVCAISGVSAGLWGRNLAAWVVGTLVAIALASWTGRRTTYVVVVIAMLGLCASLFDAGLEGVHRWVQLGPVRVNAAMLVSPSLVVATAVLAARGWWGWLPAMFALVVLAMQPDASQATALALAVCALAAVRRTDRLTVRGAVAGAAILIAGWSWTRPDPLTPVPEVEEVIQLAASHSIALAAAGVLLLAALAATPLLATRGRKPGLLTAAGLALTALLAGWVVAPALGAFPTPLIGVGLSPVLGVWFGIGLLAALDRWADGASA